MTRLPQHDSLGSWQLPDRHVDDPLTRGLLTRGDIKGVSVQGRAEFLPDSAEHRALATRLLDKYHPQLERFWSGRATPANRVMLRVTP